MKFDPARLFEPRKPPKPLYPTIRAELDAIRTHKKKMSVIGVTPEQVVDGDSYYFEILELAFERGLAVVLQSESSKGLPRNKVPHPRVFVARPEELWRVPAILTSYAAGWSTATEIQRSLLLGYTPAQCKRYMAWQQQRECEGMNIYTLLSREQKERVIAYGNRCFGTATEVEGMTFFLHRSGRPRANAASLVPKGLTFARTGVLASDFKSLFPRWGKTRNNALHTARVTRKQASALLDGLADNVQFLTASGWK